MNLASRLEGLTKRYGSPLLISETTQAAVVDAGFSLRQIDAVRVKGREEPSVVYEVLDALPAAVWAVRERDIAAFHRGLKSYQSGDFSAATADFTAVAQAAEAAGYPDRVAEIHLDRLRTLSLHGVPKNWRGVFTATMK